MNMKKTEKKFRFYAILVIFVLSGLLLAVINGLNFTMAAEDADRITQTIAEGHGSFAGGGENMPGGGENMPGGMESRPEEKDFRMGPMGPDSPEMNASLRYFTIAFYDQGKTVETVAYRISAISENEAREWAAKLTKETTGWTKGTYRYRVYEKDNVTYVTVIDQGRELLPCYRILIISAVGEALCLVIGWLVLLAIGRKIYAPIEEADRKQKNFIRNANKEFRIPLTVISGNTELLERKYGPDDETRSTRRQLEKLNTLVERLGTLGVFEDDMPSFSKVPVSELLEAALGREKEKFAARGIELTTEIEQGILLEADPQAIERMIGELVDNAQKFALSKVSFTLKKESGYLLLETKNDADLPNGPADQVFDRFTLLSNAKAEAGAGLGLACVKEIVKMHKGRATAFVSDKIFTLRITF